MKVATAKVRAKDAKSKDVAVYGDTLETAIQNFLDFQTTEVKGIATEIKDEKGKTTGYHYTGTVRQYRQILTDRLMPFLAEHGVHHVQGLTVPLLNKFIKHGLADLFDTSRTTAVKYLRRFLKWTYGTLSDTSLKVPLHSYIATPSSRSEPTMPYSKEEVTAILKAAETMNDKTVYGCDGPRFRLLCELLEETGMRRGDAIRYLPSKCFDAGNGTWKYKFRPQKTPKKVQVKLVTTYISDRLKKAIDNCTWMSTDRPFAHSIVDLRDDSPTDTTSAMADQVSSRFKAIGKQIGLADCRTHRMRDTFAVNFLLDGGSMTDLSQLLGHSSVKITQDHYAPFVPEREERLDGIMAERNRRKQAKTSLAIAA